MEFRPCIDIHNGRVKQIVGSSLKDEGDAAHDNFVSEKSAGYFARLYQSRGLKGGHIIMLNHQGSSYYEKTREQAMEALRAYPGGMQIGGGINADNITEYLEAGASHGIVTSYVFSDGRINYDHLKKLYHAAAEFKRNDNIIKDSSDSMTDKSGTNHKDQEKTDKTDTHIVLDLSCRLKDHRYYVVTDRWQNFTTEEVTVRLLEDLSEYCDEFLIHAADVEGKQAGPDRRLIEVLAEYEEAAGTSADPVTYAGGIHSYQDINDLREMGHSRINFTIGSALDLFGGHLSFEKIADDMIKKA